MIELFYARLCCVCMSLRVSVGVSLRIFLFFNSVLSTLSYISLKSDIQMKC